MDDPRPALLRKAAALVGREELADALLVRPELLDAWMSGTVPMPERKLLVLADFLNRISQPK